MSLADLHDHTVDSFPHTHINMTLCGIAQIRDSALAHTRGMSLFHFFLHQPYTKYWLPCTPVSPGTQLHLFSLN